MTDQVQDKEKNSEKKERITIVPTTILTSTGCVVDLLAGPASNSITIEDIAHSLSHQCRFAGHSSRFYSIAEHSVYVALMVPKLFRIYFLLHDAHEYLYQDITKPLKEVLGGKGTIYDRLCDKCDLAIMRAFELNYDKLQNLKSDIKTADNYLLDIERGALFFGESPNDLPEDNILHGKPFGLSPKKAKKLFLDCFNDLMR